MNEQFLSDAEEQFIKALWTAPEKWADIDDSSEFILNCFNDQGLKQVAERLLAASDASDPEFAAIEAQDQVDELRTSFEAIDEKMQSALNSESAIGLLQATQNFKAKAGIWKLMSNLDKLRAHPDKGLYFVEQIQAVSTEILGRFQESKQANILTGKQIALRYNEKVQAEYEEQSNGEGTPGVKFNLKALDKTLKGMRPTQFCVIAGRPSAGKSSLLYQAIYHSTYTKKEPCLIVNMELPIEEQAARYAANHRRIGQSVETTVSELFFDESAFSKLGQSIEAISESPIFMVDDTSLTIDDIEREVRKHKLQHGLKTLAIDYLTLIPGIKGEKADHLFFTKIANRLKHIAKKYDILVLACAQLNRESAKEKRPPTMQDLRESGGIEQAADKIIGVWRRENSREALAETGQTYMTLENGHIWSRVIVMKNRQGAPGNIFDLSYDAINGVFYEYETYE